MIIQVEATEKYTVDWFYTEQADFITFNSVIIQMVIKKSFQDGSHFERRE